MRVRATSTALVAAFLCLGVTSGCGDSSDEAAPQTVVSTPADATEEDEAARVRLREIMAARLRAGQVGWELAWGNAWDAAAEERARERFDAFRLDTAGTVAWTFLLTLLVGGLAGGLLAWRRLSGPALEDALTVLADSRAIDRHLGAIAAVWPTGDTSDELTKLGEALDGWRADNSTTWTAAATSPTRADRVAGALESQRALADRVRVEICRRDERDDDLSEAAAELHALVDQRQRVPEVESTGPPGPWARPAGLGGLASVAIGMFSAGAWAAAGLVPAALPLIALGAGIAALLVAQSEVRRHGGSGILPRLVEAPAAWLLRGGVAVFIVVLVSSSASVDSGMDLGEAPVAPVEQRPDAPDAPTLAVPGPTR